jgi:hypothetical protein
VIKLFSKEFENIRKLIQNESKNIFSDLNKSRAFSKRIEDEISKAKREMDEKRKKFRLIQSK